MVIQADKDRLASDSVAVAYRNILRWNSHPVHSLRRAVPRPRRPHVTHSDALHRPRPLPDILHARRRGASDALPRRGVCAAGRGFGRIARRGAGSLVGSGADSAGLGPGVAEVACHDSRGHVPGVCARFESAGQPVLRVATGRRGTGEGGVRARQKRAVRLCARI